MTLYMHFFGFQRDPSPQEIKVEDLYPLSGLKASVDRFLYALDLDAVSVITREVGTGQFTSLRYASAPLHPSQYRLMPVKANTGMILELLRRILLSLQVESRSLSVTVLTKTLRANETHLMRIEVFTQLHTPLHFDFDFKPLVPPHPLRTKYPALQADVL